MKSRIRKRALLELHARSQLESGNVCETDDSNSWWLHKRFLTQADFRIEVKSKKLTFLELDARNQLDSGNVCETGGSLMAASCVLSD